MMWILLTVMVFFFARSLAKRFNSPFVNPLVISVSIIISILIYSDVHFDTYYANNEWLSYLMQPAVVALAYPLYEQLPEIRTHWRIIILACGVGSIMSMFTTAMIAYYLKTEIHLIASLLGKSVTTPIAMEISTYLGGEPSIAAILVLLVGVFGAVFAYPIYHLIGVKNPIARGLTMGTVSHALGTAACAESHPKDAAYSSLALVACGVITSILAPSFFALALWLG